MGAPMPDIVINLDCGHEVIMPQWDHGDRRITCDSCGRTWIMTSTKIRTHGIQTKSEVFTQDPIEYKSD